MSSRGVRWRKLNQDNNQVRSNPIGHIDLDAHKKGWHELSDGTIVSFHTAFTSKDRTESVVFVSDNETFAGVTAERLGIKYFFMRNSTDDEIEDFLRGVDSLVVKDEEE